MVQLLPSVRRLATFVVALAALGTPDSLLAIDYCRCAKIGPGVCIPDPLCRPAVHGLSPDEGVSLPLNILETGYSVFKNIGDEEPGYSLYSYAIIVNDNERSAKFLDEIFNAIPRLEDTPQHPSKTNIFYIPLKNDTAEKFIKVIKVKEGYPVVSGADYENSFYDYKMARTLLDHLCDSPSKDVKKLCKGDLSRGPYIFTYSKAASQIDPVPPPFLFLDLSDVHEHAFPEFIAAFKAQVKREHISDLAKIKTLRLRLLSVVLTAADWVVPVQKAVTDIVHTPNGHSEKDRH